MTTARDLIKASLKKIGVLGIGETPEAEMENDAFNELNRMLDIWSTKSLLVFGITIEEFLTVASTQSYTLGDGGDWDTDVPINVDSAYFRYDDSTDRPIRIIDNKRWGELNPKDLESTIISHMYIDDNYPLRTVYLFPIPSEAKTILLHNYRQISSIATLTTTLQFKKGYEDAILYNLAIRLCPDYGKTASPEIVQIASDSLASIKRANIRPVTVGVDSALLNNRRTIFDFGTD